MELLDRLVPIVKAAGELIMQIYSRDFSSESKADDSPVTLADQRAEALITAALRNLLPEVPVVAEEAVAAGDIPAVCDRFWLVDPLDGTKEFIKRNGEFTVNIALIEGGVPVIGVVLAPALGQLFIGVVGSGAFLEQSTGERRQLACRVVPSHGLTVVASRSHADMDALAGFLNGRKMAELRSAGSSLKLCLLACGEADLYPDWGGRWNGILLLGTLY